VSLCNSDFDTKLHIYSGACGALTCVDSNDDGALCAAFSLQSSITFTSTLGTPYYFLAGGYGTSTGNLEINISCIPAGAIVWNGGTSADYSNALNWTPNVLPTCADDVFVPLTANNPTITGAFECGDFGTASSVTPSVAVTGSLSVCGNVSLATGTQITGTGVMRLIGTNTAGAGLFDVVGSASIERLSVESNYAGTGNIDLITALEMNGGNFDASAAVVTLKSTATGTAYLDDFSLIGGTYIGNITVERFVTAGVGLGQRFLGSAVSGSSATGLDMTYASGFPQGAYVTPDVCNVSLLAGSAYSNLFQYEQANVSPGDCDQIGWFAMNPSQRLIISAIVYALTHWGARFCGHTLPHTPPVGYPSQLAG
jgi:hypothetical protein